MAVQDKDAILGFSFLNFTEQCGIPLQFLATVSIVGAAKRIQQYSQYLAFVILIRCGNAKQSNWLFSRNVLSKLEASEINNYVTFCINTIKNNIKEIAKLDNSHVDSNFCVEITQVMPEILSRLCTKAPIETLQTIADFIVEIYLLPEKDKQAFQGVANLVRRLIKSYPTNRVNQLFETIKKIDWKLTENYQIVNNEFIDPYLIFLQFFDDIIEPSPEEIEDALKKMESTDEQIRIKGMILCYAIRNSFNEDQKKKYAELLWDKNFLDETGFPKNNVFLRSSFIKIPHPEGINVTELFKKLIFEKEQNKDDDFSNSINKFFIKDNCSKSFTYNFICDELQNGFGINASNRIKLDVRETKTVFDYVQNYWNENKQYLTNKSQNNIQAFVSDNVKMQFNDLLKIILCVIIPNVVELDSNETTDIKQLLDDLLNEMEKAHQVVDAIKIVFLAIFPDRLEETKQYIQRTSVKYSKQEVENIITGIWFLLIMKHKEIPIEIDIHQFIPYIIEHIKFWLSPGLSLALNYLGNIISDMPEYINDEIVKEILPVLEILIDETNPIKLKTRIAESELLDDRRKTMRLASNIFKYFEKQNKEQPDIILKWKELAESDNEFWEIKNQWES
ncbi:MAG: hypothetical protein LBP59_09900 [Planctomycetaceae bacterium]|jgi:hypothetical protein|nr:hypothetical protein [Planctomycetaceae bacterium]